jgi:phage terminase large subunit-like protein
MPKPFDYGYPFDFPRSYHPGNSAEADQYYFDEAEFNRYVQVIESCVYHIKGPLSGTTLKLEKWQKDIIAALFGLKHKETHKRRYSEGLLYVPRKNGKSMLCSALVIAYLVIDQEKGKEVVSVAGSSDQASLIYKPIRVSLKESSSPLNHPSNKNPNCKFKVLGNPRKIISANELNTYVPLTADGDRNHGLNVSLSVMDEIHSWKQKQGAALYEAIVTSMGMRESPLNLIITTADYSRDSICNDKFKHGLRVADNSADDPTFLPVLYFLDVHDDWTDEKNWAKCNPQLGKSISLDFYRKEIKKAQTDPTYTNSFKRLYMNIQTQSESKFLDYAKWVDSEDKDNVDLTGQTCYAGLDLAFKSDLCALVLEFPYQDKYYIKTLMWLPEKHPKINFYKSKGWIDDKEIIVTEGNAIDFRRVREDIVEICRNYDVEEFGYDPRFATELVMNLENEHNLPMVEINQSPRFLSEPLKDIAVSILDDKFRHDGNKCASWQLGNSTSKELHNGLIQLVKPQGNDATLAKVDFTAALSMSHFLTLKNMDEDMDALLSNENYSFL